MPLDLPLEIILDILDLTCSSSQKFCSTSCLVATWTRHLALPHMLTTVFLRDDATLSNFKRYITNPPYKPLDRKFNHAALVRNIWMTPSMDYISDACSIMRACTHVVHFATTSMALTGIFFQVSSRKPSKRSLFGMGRRSREHIHLTIVGRSETWNWSNVMYQYRMLSFGNAHTLLRSVRHIHFTQPEATNIADSLFLGLTHVAMTLGLQYSELEYGESHLDMLSIGHGVMLKMFVLVLHDQDILRSSRFLTWLRSLRAADPRVYVIHLDPDEIEMDWVWEAQGELNIWDRAVRQTIDLLDLDSDGDLL